MPKRLLPQYNSKALLVWFIVILGITIFSFARTETLLTKTNNLANENSKRITEISKLRNSQILLVKRTDAIICNKFAKPLRVTLHANLTNLPKIAYYKEHPEELKDALAQTRKALKLFSVKSCNNLPSKGLKPLKVGH